MSHCNLTLAFFSPEKNDHYVNRLVAKASLYPYCHVELFFETTNQAFSILWNENVMLREKSFSSPCYDIVTLSVSQAEYSRCLQFCQKMVKENIAFDEYGMWTSYFYVNFCLPSSSDRKKTFCSKIICEALQYANVQEVAHMTANFSTPSRLYNKIMHSHRRVCASVPYKCNQLLNRKQIVCFKNKLYYRLYDSY